MTGDRTVVVTGLGVVSAAGCGAEPLAEALATSQEMRGEVDRSAGYHRPGSARQAVLATEVDLAEWLKPLEARRMSRASRYAVASARMAVAEAGIGGDALGAASVFVATAYGAAEASEKILRQVMLEGPEAVSPALFTESVANAPAAHVALALGARGANVTVTQRQAGPLLALGQGVAAVAHGRAEVAVVGAVDELNPLLHAILDRFGALARPDADGREVARPFDARRRGCLAADGGAMVVLEREKAARRRGARVLARVGSVGAAFDPDAPPAGWSRDPGRLAEALRGHLHGSAPSVGGVDRLVSGGCGLQAADRLEALVLREAFGTRPLPPVLAPKAVVGEHGGGFLAAALLACGGATFGPTAGFGDVDPELGLVPHDGRTLAPPRSVLATTFAAGGSAAWATLAAGDP